MKKYAREIERELGNEQTNVRQLWEYHNVRMEEFRHERIIHLLVLGIVAIATIVILVGGVATNNLLMLTTSVLLIPLLIAYIFYYRKLENGVQSLTDLTEEIGKKLR